ncbi:MAG: tetratricopeptide repeat protein [Candidatus Nomurabacteria bacterium]
MKSLASFFSKVYCYVTAFIVVGSPLFFIPKTSFSPEVSYQMTMTIAISIALVSYIISALITRTWHTISKLEFLAYGLFTLSVVGSVVFARNPMFSLFGEYLNTYNAVSLLSLVAVMYLVRALPEALRHRLKMLLVGILGTASVVFIFLMLFTGQIMNFLANLFSGFTSPASLAAYIGIFVIAMLFYVKRTKLSMAYKISLAFAAVVILAWAIAISANDGVRPNLTSSLLVGKEVLIKDGLFGIGANGYSRAWQLYRPLSVVESQYFGSDFEQGFGTTTTLFTTIGIFGVLAFILLGLAALYSTYRSYREENDTEEKAILEILGVILLYFAIVAWIIPLSYAMLVTWMVIAGLGLAKAKLTAFHPNKAAAFVLVPLAVILVLYSYMSINKSRAGMYFNKAANAVSAKDKTANIDNLVAQATSIYPYDGFYRWHLEYIISEERAFVAQENKDQEAMKKTYLENAQKAVDAGKSAVKANPDNYQNYVSLGRAYELAVMFDKENAYKTAKKSYEEAIKLYPENPYLYVILARLEASAGTKEGVRTQLTEALKKKQNFADALYLMSQLESSESKGEEALKYAVEAVKNAPGDPLVYTQAGLLYYGKKDYQNAYTNLNTALEKDPNNANVAYFLALTLRDGGQPGAAKQIGQELLRRNPGNADLEAFLKSIDTLEAQATQATSKPAAKK